jgi:cytochrome c553
MKRILATSLIAFLALGTACSEKKAQDKQEEQGSAKSETGDNQTGDASGETPAAEKKLVDLYPPVIDVFALSAPDFGRSLYFGYTADGAVKFEMIWIYAIAALPNFDAALELPDFQSQAEFDAFMEKWATEFQSHPDFETFTKLQNEFSFKVDPAFLGDAPYPIPAEATAGQPNYVTVTQKFFARRYTTKAAGNTTISASVDGANFSVPVVITGYTAANLAAGKARYETDPNEANASLSGCVGCHGSRESGDAFAKHSSDYLAYATDAEILNLVKTSTYPNGAQLNNGTHTFSFATPQDETNIIGYLRSFPTSFDKLQPVAETPAALRLR